MSTRSKKLFDRLSSLSSESRNRRTLRIDEMSVRSILRVINQEDSTVAIAVRRELPAIEKAVACTIEAFQAGGRLIYVGAGTSGRLGILDATECPPTFGTNPRQIQGIVAGGKKAVFRSQEGAEDDSHDGALQIREKNVSQRDVVCGIAASIRTPFVAGAIREAKKRGATTIFVTTNPRSVLLKKHLSELRKNIDVAICVDVGPEVIMGSTRMKAGTAQKLVLNMMTTTAMIRLGKVYQNMMVDLKMTSRKLEERAKKVLMLSTGMDYKKASLVLKKANGHVKTAIVMAKANTSAKKARSKLNTANGFVRAALHKTTRST